MSNVDAMITVYVRERRRLESWLGQWLSTADAEDIAGSVCADWFYQACEGSPTQYGAYYQLYMHAEPLCRRLTERQGRAMLIGARDTVALPSDTDLCDISRAYAAVYLAARLVELTWVERSHLSRIIREHRLAGHSISTFRAELLSEGSDNVLLRGMYMALDHHIHEEGDLCSAASEVWEHEDMRCQYWVRRRRDKLRKGHHAQIQQNHDPDHPRSTL